MPPRIEQKLLAEIEYYQKPKQMSLSKLNVCFCSLEGYMGIMDRSARLLVSEMSWAADKEAIDMQQPIQDMTLNVVGQSAFGYGTSSF